MTDESAVKAVFPDAEWDMAHGCIWDRARHPPAQILSGVHWWTDEEEAWEAASKRILAAPSEHQPKGE